jgi:hypothetical protein
VIRSIVHRRAGDADVALPDEGRLASFAGAGVEVYCFTFG